MPINRSRHSTEKSKKQMDATKIDNLKKSVEIVGEPWIDESAVDTDTHKVVDSYSAGDLWPKSGHYK